MCRDRVKHDANGGAFKRRIVAEANRDTAMVNTEAEVRRARSQSNAEADAQRLSARAAWDAAKARAEGEAFAQRARATAEAPMPYAGRRLSLERATGIPLIAMSSPAILVGLVPGAKVSGYGNFPAGMEDKVILSVREAVATFRKVRRAAMSAFV
jgi:hypothetical protein